MGFRVSTPLLVEQFSGPRPDRFLSGHRELGCEVRHAGRAPVGMDPQHDSGDGVPQRADQSSNLPLAM